MKILLVCQYYYPERFSVSQIAEGLLKEGNEVTVLTGKPNYGFGKVLDEYKKIKTEEINGVHVNRVNLIARKKSKISIMLNYLSFHNSARRFVRHYKDKFDIVLSISLSPVISISPALLYGKKHNIPVVLYCEDIWPESTVAAGMVRPNSFIYKILFKWSYSIYSKLDKIIISSPSFKNYFEDVLKITNKGYKVIYQPTLTGKKTEEEIKYENTYNLVYAGNIGELQNVNLIVDAMRYVKTSDVKLHLLGIGSQLEHVKDFVDKYNLHNIVTYDGAFPIEKTEAFFKNASALIISLKNDNFVGKTVPNKAIQYLKYSKPIIANISGDGKDLLSKAGGTIFTENNVKSIAEAIDNLCLMSKEEKERLGKNNLSFYQENLTNEKIISLINDELKETLKLK